MKSFLVHLRLYLKASWWVTAVVVPLAAFIILPSFAYGGVLSWVALYPLFFVQFLALAYRFHGVDKLLASTGLSPRRRMAAATTAWTVHLLPIWLMLLLLPLATPLFYEYSHFARPRHRHFSLSSVNLYDFAPFFWQFTMILLMSLALLATWIDLQARRLSSLSALDSPLFFVLCQILLIIALVNLASPFPSIAAFGNLGIQISADLTFTSNALSLTFIFALIVSRLVSVKSLLSHPEVI